MGFNPTLPGVGIFLKFMSVLGLMPFGWNQKEGRMYARHRVVLYYWAFMGVILPAVHSVASTAFFGKLVYSVCKTDESWHDVQHLLGLTLTVLLILGNAGFTGFAAIVMQNYEETIKLYNETIRVRIQLRGKSPKVNPISKFFVSSLYLALSHRSFPESQNFDSCSHGLLLNYLQRLEPLCVMIMQCSRE